MEANELKLQVTLQPWFSIFAEELARAGEDAARRGVSPSMVYAGIRSALSAVVSDAVSSQATDCSRGRGAKIPTRFQAKTAWAPNTHKIPHWIFLKNFREGGCDNGWSPATNGVGSAQGQETFDQSRD